MGFVVLGSELCFIRQHQRRETFLFPLASELFPRTDSKILEDIEGGPRHQLSMGLWGPL